MGTDGREQDRQVSRISWKDDVAFEVTTGNIACVRLSDRLVLRYS